MSRAVIGCDKIQALDVLSFYLVMKLLCGTDDVDKIARKVAETVLTNQIDFQIFRLLSFVRADEGQPSKNLGTVCIGKHNLLQFSCYHMCIMYIFIKLCL